MDDKDIARPQVKKRDEVFADKAQTKIWKEIASTENPYLAERALCHGYDFVELIKSRSFIEVVFLLLKGELPSQRQTGLLEKLALMLCNPGPRHPAVRAAMNASVSGVDPVHILPIGLSILGGEYLGATEVKNSIRFIQKNLRHDPVDVAQNLRGNAPQSNHTIAPGFGKQFNGIDPLASQFAEILSQEQGADHGLRWGNDFVTAIKDSNQGWLRTGVAAAAMVDLGFKPDAGACFYQFASAPGLLAHGLEMVGKPITAMPFVPDEKYRYSKAESNE